MPLKLWPALVSLELRYEAAHAREAATAPGGDYYYLSFIATAPAARGKGYASQLLRHVTARADAEGRLCLLEATSALSRALYERHGFVCYETYHVTPAAPPVFFMRRDPRPADGAPERAAAELEGCAERKAPAATAAALAASDGGCGSGDSVCRMVIPSALVTLRAGAPDEKYGQETVPAASQPAGAGGPTTAARVATARAAL